MRLGIDSQLCHWPAQQSWACHFPVLCLCLPSSSILDDKVFLGGTVFPWHARAALRAMGVKPTSHYCNIKQHFFFNYKTSFIRYSIQQTHSMLLLLTRNPNTWEKPEPLMLYWQDHPDSCNCWVLETGKLKPVGSQTNPRIQIYPEFGRFRFHEVKVLLKSLDLNGFTSRRGSSLQLSCMKVLSFTQFSSVSNFSLWIQF